MISSDPRIGDLIDSSGESPVVNLIEFPSDEGVITNGGRPGASKAPELIRQFLLKFTPHSGYIKEHLSLLKRITMKRINCEGTVQADQEKLGDAVSSSFQQKAIPVILGGGHETSFGHFLGYANSDQPVSIFNIDAHTDVRPLKNGLPHSGSPFYQSLTHPSGRCQSYHVFGLNPASVALEHLEFVQKNGSAVFESDVTAERVLGAMNEVSANIMVTMDMDAVNQSQAPGVSAPNASGVASQLWLELAFQFGNHPKVTSFDLCEVNPEFDRDHQTVRLAALTVWYFLLGVALREG